MLENISIADIKIIYSAYMKKNLILKQSLKEKIYMSFRFEDHVLNKIDYLMQEDKKKLEKLGIKPRTRKELVEGIIDDYYLRYITKTRDPDVLKRIELMVEDTASNRFKGIEDKIDELLFLAIKSDLGKRVFYRSPSFRHLTLSLMRHRCGMKLWKHT